MKEILRIENISKSFSGVKALDNMHLGVRKGEVHAILGENGAGKSTIMNIMTGVYTKDEGKIYFKEKEFVAHSPKNANAKGISIIFQEFNLMPHLSIMDNIFVSKEICNPIGMINKKKQDKLTRIQLLRLNCHLDPGTLIKDINVADQQIVEIAKALSFKCELLIMDEPTSALTDSETEKLFQIIEILKKGGTTIIYISHRMQELKQIADRVTIIRDGRYIATFNYHEITEQQLIKLMVGRTIKDIYPKRKIKKIEQVILEAKDVFIDQVIDHVSFQLYKGEVLGIAGLMGAGRTELMRAIFGAERIESGEIFINGKKVAIRSPRDAIKNKICYLTEDRKKYGLNLNLSVMDNILISSFHDYAGLLGYLNQKACESRVNSLVKKLKIKTASIFNKIKFLSGGNQQKVIISKWLNTNADIFIFDEPTRGIDVGAKSEIYVLINQLVAQGKSVIIISSELPEIVGMCDRVIVMNNHKISGVLTDNITQERIMNYATDTKHII